MGEAERVKGRTLGARWRWQSGSAVCTGVCKAGETSGLLEAKAPDVRMGEHRPWCERASVHATTFMYEPTFKLYDPGFFYAAALMCSTKSISNPAFKST